MSCLDYGKTDNGENCETQCGKEGLFEGRYWCDTLDSWDFCKPKSKGNIDVICNIAVKFYVFLEEVYASFSWNYVRAMNTL